MRVKNKNILISVEQYLENWFDTEETSIGYPIRDIQSYKEMVEYFVNELFENHKGKVVLNNKRVLVLDWCSKDDYNGYDMHYVLDKKTGSFSMVGETDLGSGMVSWNESLSVEDLIERCKHKWWLVDNLQSEWKYTYHNFFGEEDVEAEINKILSEERGKQDFVRKDMETLREMYRRYHKDIINQRDFYYLKERYSFDKAPEGWGMRVTSRVYFWVTGFYMACKDTGLIA